MSNSHRIPPLAPGYKRDWYQCKVCGFQMYMDYVPYSMSNPVVTSPCGHDFREHAVSIDTPEWAKGQGFPEIPEDLRVNKEFV